MYENLAIRRGDFPWRGSVGCEADMARFMPFVYSQCDRILQTAPSCRLRSAPSSEYLTEEEIAIGGAGIYGVCVLGPVSEWTEPDVVAAAYAAHVDMATVERRQQKELLTPKQAELARAQIRNALLVVLAQAAQMLLVMMKDRDVADFDSVFKTLMYRFPAVRQKPGKLSGVLFRFSVYQSFAAIQCWLRQISMAVQYRWKRHKDVCYYRRATRVQHSAVPIWQPAFSKPEI